MSFALAQVVCLSLMTADMVARTWRIVWLLRGIGQTVTFADALVLNAFGDAAAALTPARLGGEPARLAGIARAGVRPVEGVVAISYEVAAAWPVIIGFGALLLWAFAPEWLATRRRSGGICSASSSRIALREAPKAESKTVRSRSIHG